jgi:HlyD family secretion protein
MNATYEQRRGRVRRFWIIAAVVVAALITWGLWPRATEVDIATIDKADVRVDLIDEGRTRMHDVYTVSAPISGRVLRVEVEPGDTVARGDVIARMTSAPAGFLDSRSDSAARAGVDASEAALRAAETDLALARREHTRTHELAAQKLVAQAAVDASQARLDAAVASRDAANANLARARSALQPAERRGGATILIRAPAAGSVLRVPQKSENVLPAGSPLIEIGDPSHVEVVAEFLSQDAVRMKAGASALIENWGGDPLKATVERVEPVARMKISALGVEEQRTNVILQFADPAAAAALGHDYRVDARVAVEEIRDTVRTPLGALFRQGEDWAVYKLSDGRATLTPVQAGSADTNFRAISSGLAAGDQVILFPGDAIHDGLRVKPRGK